MEQPYTTGTITALAQTCMILGEEERPELEWLGSRYEHIQNKYHLKNKRETDRFLYQRMYGHEPEKDSAVLKIRYWRTGKYTPGNREQCLLFGRALELSDAEMKYLIQGYYDRSLEVYGTVTELISKTSTEQKTKLHKERQQYMQQLVDTYLSRVSQEQLKKLNIPPGRETHFFRHLLILGMPDITLGKLNEQLHFFGYLPLSEDHTMVQGERLDWLLIQLLTRYEDLLKIKDQQTCLLWFQKVCRTLDLFFMREGLLRMRFMHFKALDL